jgi:RecB family endonuclease NucS
MLGLQIADHDGGLGKTTVQTEVYTGDGRIDILILNESEGWAVIVENKIWTTEHSDQLERYYRFVKRTYRVARCGGST